MSGVRWYLVVGFCDAAWSWKIGRCVWLCTVKLWRVVPEGAMSVMMCCFIVQGCK